MATDDKGKDPGKQNATPSAKGGDEKNTEIEQMKVANQQLLMQNQKLQTDMEELKGVVVSPQYQAFLDSTKKPDGKFVGTNFAAGGAQEVDLETMDRAQFLQHIGQVIDGKLSTVVAPRIDKLSQDMQRDSVRRSLKDAREMYKDFDNHRLTMSQTSARIEKEGISADDLYKIASHPGAKEEKPAETPSEKPGGGGDVTPSGKEETSRETAERIGEKLFGD